MTTILEVAVILLISAGIYYGVPLLLAKMYTVDYKVHPSKEASNQKGFLVRPEPNHGLVVKQGPEVVRYLIGGQYVLARKNGRYKGEEGFNSSLENILAYSIPKRASEKYNFEELGGELSPLFSFLEGWIFSVTGCRFIGTNFAEVLSAELASYKAKRPEDVRSTTPRTDKDDRSRYVVLSEQVLEVEVSDSETGGIVKVEGAEVRSTARYSSTIQVVFQICGLRQVYLGPDEYFPVIEAQVKSSVNEVIRGASTDDLLRKEWIKDNIEHAPLRRNGNFPEGFPQEVVDNIPEYKRALGMSEDKGTNGDEYANNNLLGLFGFLFISASLIKGDFDKKTQEGFERQQQAILGVQTAAREKQADELRAQGEASYTEQELGALAKAARDLREYLGGRAAEVLVAQQHGRAARDAGEGVIVSLGGQSPTPLIQLDQGGRGKRDTSEEKAPSGG